MNIQPDIKLDFKDISLISRQISTIGSRDEINISSKIFNKEYNTPIIASPMKDVCDKKLAEKMINLGGQGVIHRFSSIEEQIHSNIFKEAIYAIGINGDYLERYKALVNAGVKYFCIDVANSSSIYVKEAIQKLLKIQKSEFIVGNVISKEGIIFYEDTPEVIGFRVSVASGKACTTKNATGMYYPPISLLLECREITDKVIIADGGIKEPQDYCKAIACGADFIMLGSVIAQTKDSPAEIIVKDGKEYKLYHGSASYENQKLYKNIPKYIEGRTVLLEFKHESLEEVLTKFQEGLKSSMSYANARNIEEYRKNVEIIIVN
jgi:IMP dehydrogenase